MVILLNLLPAAIILTLVFIGYRWFKKDKLTISKSIGLMVLAFALITILNALTPSYMPKGVSKKLPNPTFEKSDAQIEDRNLKPELSPEQRQERFDEKLDAVKQATEK